MLLDHMQTRSELEKELIEARKKEQQALQEYKECRRKTEDLVTQLQLLSIFRIVPPPPPTDPEEVRIEHQRHNPHKPAAVEAVEQNGSNRIRRIRRAIASQSITPATDAEVRFDYQRHNPHEPVEAVAISSQSITAGCIPPRLRRQTAVQAARPAGATHHRPSGAAHGNHNRHSVPSPRGRTPAQGIRSGNRHKPPPPPPPTDVTKDPGGPMGKRPSQKKDDEKMQLFEVEVPKGVQPGKPFAVLAGGVRVLVTCPPNASPGQRIRFKLPLALTQAPKPTNEAALVKLKYDKDGWTRTIRVSDMKFQWVRMDEKGDVDTNTRFDAERSAYVRKLDVRKGDDPRLRTGVLSLVPATEAFVASEIKDDKGNPLVGYASIAEAQVKTFEDKAAWFQEKCSLLCVEWNEGHMLINVRRSMLLGDSIDAVMSLSRKDLRKLWRFEFVGEAGLDAGGLAREWFQLVTEEVFDPDMGLWQSSESNQKCMQINPASEFVEDHLVYYRFLGRVMGKALFDRQLVAGHMVQYIYKHFCGWPIAFKDLKAVDEEYYNYLRQMQDLVNSGQDLSMLCLDFTTTMEVMGEKQVVELVEGGKDIEVDNDNFPEYLEACLKYRMMDRVKAQLNELILGFFDVIPEPLLTVFDFQELELLMCGLPEIDVEDWQLHTEYSGDYEGIGPSHHTVQWFWEVVGEFDQEMKARLLQFVTGTSGVPSRGFGVLQGNDGNVRKFTIHGLSVNVCLYPRAHTCFNRIDLPMYESLEDLREKLKLAITMDATGFDIE